MKQIPTIRLVIVLIASLTSHSVWARGGGWHGGGFGGGHHFGGGFHGRHHGGIGLGFYGLGYGPGFYGGYYPYGGFNYGGYGYGYPPTVITVPVTPPVYIQQAPPVAQQYPAGYWYYCSSPEGYYPHIKACPNGWQQVAPTPPPPPSRR